MKKLPISIFLASLILFSGCSNEDSGNKDEENGTNNPTSESDNCNNQCQEWQTCKDRTCVTLEGFCSSNDDCNENQQCKTETHKCVEKENSKTDSCNDNKDCKENQQCNTETHVCVDKEAPQPETCNDDKDCKENQQCSTETHKCVGKEDSKTDSCNANEDCKENQQCNTETHKCVEEEIPQPDSCNDSFDCKENQQCDEETHKCVEKDNPTPQLDTTHPVDNEKYCDGQCGVGVLADQANCFILNPNDLASSFCSGCSLNCELDQSAPYCVAGAPLLSNGYGCSAIESCPEGQGFKVNSDGMATCEPLPLNSCTSNSNCSEGQYCNLETRTCVDDDIEEAHYIYVRIDDLSDKCVNPQGTSMLNDNGICTLYTPGADIDAVVLIKPNGSHHYATDVVGYKRADFNNVFVTLAQIKAFLGDESNNSSVDPKQILGVPDSLDTYGSDYDGTCNYFVNPNDANQVYPFVSLGGLGGWIEVEMNDMILAGDKIDVLEVGACTLKNTGEDDSSKATAEKISVSVSTSADIWKVIGQSIADQNNKGILSFTITENMLK